MVRAPQLAVLLLEPPDPPSLGRRGARPGTTIDLSLPDPAAPCLWMHAELLSNSHDRAELRRRTSTKLHRLRVARSRSSSGYFLGAATTLILHGLRASTRPVAIHPPRATPLPGMSLAARSDRPAEGRPRVNASQKAELTYLPVSPPASSLWPQGFVVAVKVSVPGFREQNGCRYLTTKGRWC